MKITAKQHEAFDRYEKMLADYGERHATNEGAVSHAFRALLEAWMPTGWALLGEQPVRGKIRVDGLIQDNNFLRRGIWEAKDTHDDLTAEIARKIKKGYPLANIIFEDTRRAVLYQNKQPVMDINLREREQLAAMLALFFAYQESDPLAYATAVDEFKERIPEIALGLQNLITAQRQTNVRFNAAFDAFRTLCRASIDPHITDAALDEMLIQHLLTERLFNRVFDNWDFTRRNIIATEIENVISALTSPFFSRADFLKSLDRFYRPIEEASRDVREWGEKQAFLNSVYERFFQGYSVRQADTHGIVYTPQEIVDFMCNSVQEVLRTEFGKTLDDAGVVILDPATGTGNFIVNLLRRVSPVAIKRKYAGELFANEIMLLPYYIASMNIEHAYYERTEEYAPFDGLCFADTLDMAESPHGTQRPLDFFGKRNTTRVQAEKDAAINVIIGNPPYNVGQRNENDNNKNRRYDVIDKRIRETYAKDSKASNRNALSDAYVKFFRWAADRLQGRDGIVCLVTNNSFVDQIAFDGMRKHLLQDFTRIWHLDLHGNVRQNPKLSGTTHNVFGIQVGVGITLAVRKAEHTDRRLYYHRAPEMWRKTEKLALLQDAQTISGIEWREMQPNANHIWRTDGMDANYEAFIPLGTKEAKATHTVEGETIFRLYGRGVATSRDDWVYDFDRARLTAKVQRFIDTYNGEVDRWARREDRTISVDDFVLADDTRIKWSESLKAHFARGDRGHLETQRIRPALYRPFCKQWLYFDRLVNERVYQMPSIFPITASNTGNQCIVMSDHGYRAPFTALATNMLPDLHLCASADAYQSFPLYTYNEDGSGRRENITDWARAQFQARYGAAVTKRDIFHYVYALLHHPEYRTRYAENLRRELPRVPFVADGDAFRAFVAAGEQLAALHLDYETAPEYALDWQTAPDAKPAALWQVRKMKLTKDRTAVVVNEALTLAGVPAAASPATRTARTTRNTSPA